MNRRAVAGCVGAAATLAAAAFAYVAVGGVSGLLYAVGVVTAALFLALKLGFAPRLGEGRFQRKSKVIAALRAELETSEQQLAELRDRLEREADDARADRTAHKARIAELEDARDRLRVLIDEERARAAEFLGELTGGNRARDAELAALERDVVALAGG